MDEGVGLRAHTSRSQTGVGELMEDDVRLSLHSLALGAPERSSTMKDTVARVF